jgi:hypothetical protein
MTASASRTAEESYEEEIYEDLLSDDPGTPQNDAQSTEDLLEELSRIREECGGFLRRYQQACGVRVTPRRGKSGSLGTRSGLRSSTPSSSTGLSSSNRRKAILHLLIEELIT